MYLSIPILFIYASFPCRPLICREHRIYPPCSLGTILHPLDIVSAQSLSTTQNTNDSSEAESSRRDQKDCLQARDVSIDDDGDLLRRKCCADLGGTFGQRKGWVELW